MMIVCLFFLASPAWCEPAHEDNLTLSPSPVDANDLIKISKLIAACKGESVKQKHPLISEFTILHSVQSKAKKCMYEQTMPNGGLMKCELGADNQKELSASFKKASAGKDNTYLQTLMEKGICTISGYEGL
ncbi:MAG: hypothetical protein R3A11_05520 [Bdellovibrionota bacterium]